MRIILQPDAWSTTIDKAPCGFLVRVRKGKVNLFLKTNGAVEGRITGPNPPIAVFDSAGNLTTVTGQVTPVKLIKED